MSRLVRITGENSWNIDVTIFERDGAKHAVRCVRRVPLGADPAHLHEVYADVRALVRFAFAERVPSPPGPLAHAGDGAVVIDMFEHLKAKLHRLSAGETR